MGEMELQQVLVATEKVGFFELFSAKIFGKKFYCNVYKMAEFRGKCYVIGTSL